jgi:hypothetical protein
LGSAGDKLQTPTHARFLSFMAGLSGAREIQGEAHAGYEPGQTHIIPLEPAHGVINEWPDAPRKAEEKLLEHYDGPNEATPAKFFRYQVGPRSRMKLTADEVLHNFLTPHADYLTQYVDYPVRSEKAGELIKFDGSVIDDRTAGQVGSRCSNHAYNTLTTNLAIEIMDGRRGVEDTRRFYGETASAFVLGRSAPYAKVSCSTHRARKSRILTNPSSPGHGS